MKEELNKDMEKPQKKRIKQISWKKKKNFLKSNFKSQLTSTPAYYNNWKTEFQGSKTK
jgi:hypothetical protein